MSSYAQGATTVTFKLAHQDNFRDTGGVGQPMVLEALLSTTADYNTLATLVCRNVSVVYPAGATSPVIDLGYGPGAGTLTLDGVTGSPFAGALTDLSRPSAHPDGTVMATLTVTKTA